jgi:hypothetical protein
MIGRVVRASPGSSRVGLLVAASSTSISESVIVRSAENWNITGISDRCCTSGLAIQSGPPYNSLCRFQTVDFAPWHHFSVEREKSQCASAHTFA